MKTFRYHALAPDGSVRRGYLTAMSVESATIALSRLGLEANRIEVSLRSPGWWQRPALIDQAGAVRSLATLLKAGVPLPLSVQTVASLTRSAVLARAMGVVSESLAMGSSAAEAVERCGALPRMAVGLIRASERTGKLDDGFVEASTLLEQELAVVARFKRALTYPIILLGTGVLSVLVITTAVLPKFATLLEDMGRELPWTTRLLLDGAMLIRQWGSLAVVGAVAIVSTLWRWGRTDSGHKAIDDLLLRVPGVASIRLASTTASFCRSLSSALRAGSPLIPALTIAADSLNSPIVRERVGDAIKDIANGTPPSTALAARHALAPSAIPLVALGEASGALAELVSRAGQLAQADADAAVERGLALIEPVLVLLIGAIVAFVAGALFQAVYGMGPVL